MERGGGWLVCLCLRVYLRDLDPECKSATSDRRHSSSNFVLLVCAMNVTSTVGD